MPKRSIASKRAAGRGPDDERVFLETADVTLADQARITRIMREFLRGFDELRGIGPCVTVFGSARSRTGTTYCDLARETGRAFWRRPGSPS